VRYSRKATFHYQLASTNNTRSFSCWLKRN